MKDSLASLMLRSLRAHRWLSLEINPAIPDSNKIEFNGTIAEMWNIDGSVNPDDIQGVQLKMILNGGDGDKVVIIPVVKDRLSLDTATVPAGVSLKALSL